ncbi:MAG: DUF4139 domain-containing protein [candidate division KSB1 bacterium]|nr:DUF4139 domain-containing protein [candidate division KSB1 bacterium]MDZ7275248.1 DUF4139 domain-containing protein [candidate division KSB1 bacterium]MDZ7287416.1 DUF4139 domain-containing protein [candidate division KSB1 bacterium]MDZ7299530.1 DUF4139 domain-containing protein [candidate division KSB1 bacterium]MDZ7309115.1 DUF4139 domain-containing protein [candidate division KSB1 bacterium]
MNREKLTAAGALLTFILSVTAVQAQKSNVRVTIYNENLALVHEMREIELPKPAGVCSFRDVAAQIDPTSVHFKSLSHPTAVRVLEQNFEYDLVSADRILQRYLDQKVQLSTRQGGTVSGTLLNAAGNLVLQAEDGTIKILNSSEIVATDLPKLPEGLITRPTLVWLVANDGPARQRVEVSYLTTGLAWHAEYVGVLHENDARLSLTGWVSIENNCGATFPEAQLLLVAGSIHRAEVPRPLPRQMRTMEMMAAAGAGFEEKEFFEYHLYTLGRAATLKDRQVKQIELIPACQTPVKKEYTYDGSRDPRKVKVTLRFKNSQQNGLGLALPAGKFRLYKPEGGAQVLVGEDFIDHTPRDEEVRLKVGDAFDLVGERTVLSTRKVGDRAEESEVKIEIRNHKDEAVTVNVLEHFHGDWTIRRESAAHTKKDATTAEWTLAVPARGRAEVTYTCFRTW